MGEMGLGYGSEYQLMRFLGHHRNELEGNILKNTRINSDLNFDLQWLDYPKDNSRGSGDGEYKGINFLPLKAREKISENWKKYWPQTGNPPNWDAVIFCTPIVSDSKLADEWIIVEAKAHLEEMESSSGATGTSREIISKAFDETKKRFDIQTNNNWFEKYYQLANRLAFVNFMLDNGINVSILNIFFINGWPNDPDKNVKNQNIWKEKIRDEHIYLGINENAHKYISDIFIEC
jgi:hypothetical protein